jgi:hypothetical protein
MSFTLWSRGSLLGELELTKFPAGTRVVAGPFRPNDAGRAVLPLFLNAMTALMAIDPMLERRGITRERLGAELGQAVHEALHQSPEGERVAQTRGALDALALELHDAAGMPVPMEQVTIQELWGVDSAAEPSPVVRARADAMGLPQYIAAVTLADPAPASRPSI